MKGLWAVVAAWLLFHALHAAVPQAVAGMVLVNLVPGLALLRLTGFSDRGLAWRTFGAGALSPPLLAGCAFTAGLLGASPGSVTWPLVLVSLVVLAVPARARRVSSAGRGADPTSPIEPVLLLCGVLLAGVVAAAFLHPRLVQWSDSWFHVAVFHEVARVGVRPAFPHFADMPLPYPWFFHVYLVAVRGLIHPDPFVLMATVNEWAAFLLGLGAYVLARAFGLSSRPAGWSAVAAFFGVNPLGSLLFLARVSLGHTRGLSVVRDSLSGTDDVMNALAWGFPSFQTAWLSRLWTPTAFNFALMLAVFLVTLTVEHWRAPRGRTFALFGIALVLLLHWHTLTALNVTLGIAAGVALAAFAAMPREGLKPLLTGVALAIGVGIAYLLARPYLEMVTLGGSNSVVRLLLSRDNLRGFLISMGPLALAALLSVGALPRETRVLFAGIAAGLLLPLLVFDLPGMAEEKLYYPLELVLAAVAGAALDRAWRGPAPARVAVTGLLVLSGLNLAITTVGFFRDAHPLRAMFDAPHEARAALYTSDEAGALAWIREHSARDGVFLQPLRPQGTEPILVHGARRLWLGPAESFYRATFFDAPGRPPIPMPVWEELQRRDALQRRAFEDGPLPATDVTDLRRRPWPVYVWVDTLLSHGHLSATLRDSSVAKVVYRSPSVQVLEVVR